MEEYANVRMHKPKSVIKCYARLVFEVVLLIACNYSLRFLIGSKCEISLFNFQFLRARRCIVLYPVDFQCVSLIFPFLKRKKSGKRANNERINDDPSTTDYSCQTLVILVVKKGKM